MAVAVESCCRDEVDRTRVGETGVRTGDGLGEGVFDRRNRDPRCKVPCKRAMNVARDIRDGLNPRGPTLGMSGISC